VLGWEYDADRQLVTNTVEPVGIFASEKSTLFCCYAVDDLMTARSAVAAAGGQVDDPREFDFGTVVGATDPQGIAFAVYQPAPMRRRPPLNGAGPGELSYVTYEVRDSGAFREFYGGVLGWTFEPGRIQDGWGVTDSHPMSGAAGGSQSPSVVPMWTVSDIGAAVTRVREAGGTVIAEPGRQSYGLSAECTDDQGARFYLGEF
jgi:predicted enzyme related to lactoylglutathione lyase